jgi:hypothetical protein
MRTLNFKTTGNESWLFEYAFPVGHDISQEHITNTRNKKSTKPIKITLPAMVKLAIDNMDSIVLEPVNYERKLDKADKGTFESRNWPDPDAMHSVRVSDSQYAALEAMSIRHFAGNKTYTILWAGTNLNWLLSKRPELANQARNYVGDKLGKSDSHVVTLRLPQELVDDRAAEAKARGITLGKLLRDQLIHLWGGTTPKHTVAEPDL